MVVVPLRIKNPSGDVFVLAKTNVPPDKSQFPSTVNVVVLTEPFALLKIKVPALKVREPLTFAE